jgi:poly-gamma-glutamate synthesis protein (capsule biosynthesis protein)
LASSPESATIKLDEINPQSASGNSQSAIWFYSAVTPFPTLADGVSLADIQGAWIGADTGPFAGRPLWMDETTLAAFTAFWGPPVEGAVSVAPVDSIVDSAWAEQPAWAIVPFESLDPRWKVLTVDGQSPVHNDFDPQTYPLKLAFSIQTSIASLPAELAALPATNRDPAKLTVLAMTGVTALVRATADQMERRGILYPGEEVRSVLRAADLTHISNEISFDPDCPPPDPWTDSLQFCSDPKYIELLEDVGTDVVELTGNHLLDYGPSDLLYTLDMYDQRG